MSAPTITVNSTDIVAGATLTATKLTALVSTATLAATKTDVLFGRSTSGAGGAEEVACTAAGRALLAAADAAAQRTALGLGGAAVLSVGTTSGTVCAGDDSRLSDSRKCDNTFDNAATSRTALGLGGAALLAVGTTSGTVCAGNDSRLSDSRKCDNTFDNAATARSNLGFGTVDIDETDGLLFYPPPAAGSAGNAMSVYDADGGKMLWADGSKIKITHLEIPVATVTGAALMLGSKTITQNQFGYALGTIFVDSDYIYICTTPATGKWKRAALSDF